jgi:hypothetical protein
MAGAKARLSYRVQPNGKSWYWEIIDSENGIVARGVANERVQARAGALRAAISEYLQSPTTLKAGHGEILFQPDRRPDH